MDNQSHSSSNSFRSNDTNGFKNSQISQNNSSNGNNTANNNQQSNNQNFAQCQFHPCRSKYFCIEPECFAGVRAACGECYTEQPHQQHKIIQQEEYEKVLKANYQKIFQQYKNVDTTHSLIERVKEFSKGIKQKIMYALDQAEMHVIREIQSKQDAYETEAFKTLNLRLKQLKQNFFFGGCATFDKTIGDFSLRLYNMDEKITDYIASIKEQRETYLAPFIEQYKKISSSLEQTISQDISPVFQLSPEYMQVFNTEKFKGEAKPIGTHTSKLGHILKFIHNQNSQQQQNLDNGKKYVPGSQNFAFTCAQDKALRLWNLGQDGDQHFEPKLWKTYQFDKRFVTCMTQANYEDLVTGSNDGYIQVWKVSDGLLKKKFSHFDDVNKNIDSYQSTSSTQLDSASQDDISSQSELVKSKQNLQFQKQQISQDISVSTLTTLNESLVVAGYNDGTVRIWDIIRGVILKSYQFCDTEPQTQFDSQQRRIGSVCKINQWIFATSGSRYKDNNDSPNKNNISVSPSEGSESGSQFNLDKAGEKKAAASNNKREVQYQVVVYDWQKAEKQQTYEGHEGRIVGVIKMGGDILVSCSEDKSIHVWDFKTGEAKKVYKEYEKMPRTMINLSDEVFATAGDDLILRFWNINEENSIANYEQLAPQNEEQIQLQSQKPNSILQLCRISETQILMGTSQLPFFHIWE